MLTTSMSHLMEVIHSILALLEDVSAYIFGRCTVNDLANIPSEDADVGDKYDVEAYIRGLEELQKAFYSSWSPTSASPNTSQEINVISDNASVEDDVQTTSDESAKTAVDWYEIINLLRPINPSGYDPDQACLDGTREVLLNKVITWTQNRENAQTFMWISGQAGMGKTAVATSLCQRLDRAQALAGAFFCVRDDPHYNSPLLLINNLICDLAMSCPAYAHQVAIAIRANPKLCSSHLSLRFEGLVKKPLQKLARISMPITLVAIVDGLDECGDHVARGKMLQHLYEMSRLVPWLKVIVTGRPVADIQQNFRDACLHKTVIHIHDYEASPDIRAYIEGQVSQLAKTERWPSESIEQLCTMSCGVFLWAALAAKYIKKSAFPALPRLRQVLSNQKSLVTDHFDALYTSVLKTAIDDNENKIKVAYLRCIGALLVTSAREPRAAPHLQHLLLGASQVDQLTLEQTKNNLGPLLVADGRHITFHHPSFKDFVTDPSRSGQFHIRLDQYEAEPAAYCLQVMQRDLCFNICHLETSHRLNREITDLSHRIDSHIGPVLTYACTHWIDHFITSPTQQLVESIKKFMEGPQLMYWIEVLSLLGSIDIALEGLSKLAGLDLVRYVTGACTISHILIYLSQTRFSDSGLVISWTKDAHRFILSFYDPITTGTPHLYVSALAFAPAKCLTALRMRPHFPNTIAVAQGGNRDWHPCIKSAVHPYVIQTLSTSPDGRHVVVGYLDGSLTIWDTQTGACLEKSIVGHRDVVTCAVYSPDGTLVASSSHDATIRVWNVTQSLQESCVLSGHSSPIHSVAFSPNSSLIASGSSDRTIRLWRPNATHPLDEPYAGHSSRVTSVAFSPDGTKLASGSWDKTIRVWSVDLGNLRLTRNPLVISEHSEPVTCVVFSPDSSKIASGSMDKTLQVWDAQTGIKSESHTSSAKHSDTVTSIAFSPDGKILASSSLDGAIQLWSATSMKHSQTFGHSSPVNTIAFSPDRSHLISGSTDMTTRVWATDAFVNNVLVKPMAVGILVGHSNWVRSIAVTRDGAWIVSASSDQTVRIWDAQTGTPVGNPLAGHSSEVYCVAVSPDGAQIVSGCANQVLKLWDTATRWKMIKQCLQGHSGTVFSVAFSPDRTCLASASADKTVILWDIGTHSRLDITLLGHTDCIRSVAFSPCGTRLVSGSHDCTVRLWDRQTGNNIHTLTGHTRNITTVAFSPNGSYLASGSEDTFVRLWNVMTGQPIGQPFAEHPDPVISVVFSPDGHYLISGAAGNTIRVRDIAVSCPTTEPEKVQALPGTFRWPSNPYEMTSHPQHSGWVTHDQESHVFWLPAHYEQHETFLDPIQQTPCSPVYLDYSKFVHGTSWTKIARNPASNSSE
ncbi:putative WD40-repeat protein (notchless protein), related protein [Rhizoctonia solani 123E]|uniref:Putative WD40-repeat protein (Notchless protein), related protein n=1 Tax=Rhizoctonia solani 123E TaxID=1423351 RepID=A0A074RLZ3_9AGAM|nr:putative WD40-repeat protein (notchless protein), related protein [Rhizoctonia solani 123E]